MNRTVAKILSILCLLAVVGCGFCLPFATLTGQYKEAIAGFTGMFASMPEEQITAMEQGLSQFNITIDFKGAIEGLNKVVEPINDGQLSMLDFVEINKAGTALGETLSTVSMNGVSEEQLQLLEQAGLTGLIEMFIMIGSTGTMIGYAALAPLGLFGLLTLAIVIRIILRLFNRRGLGVLIAIVGFLNASFMVGVTVLVQMMATPELPIGAEPTFVPYVIIGGCILSCVLWGIGRGAKVKKVKEEVVVEVPVEAPVEEVPAVEEVEATEEVTEEVVEEETPVEETVEVVEEVVE